MVKTDIKEKGSIPNFIYFFKLFNVFAYALGNNYFIVG